MSLFYKTINIMGKFIKVSRDDLYNKVRQSLSGYEVSGDTQNRLMTSVFHLVSYMVKEHLECSHSNALSPAFECFKYWESTIYVLNDRKVFYWNY